MTPYTPSSYIKEQAESGNLWPCKGLGSIVQRAIDAGYVVGVDELGFDGGPEQINRSNARQAVCELEEARILLYRGNSVEGWILVVPSNGEDWLCDYTINVTAIVEPGYVSEEVAS